jgi:hypothetical protein
MRQLESPEIMYSALVSRAEAHFTSPMAVEIIGNLVAEGAAEAAAGLGFLHFDEFEAAHFFEELAGGLFEVQLAQTVAAVVVGDLVREGPRDR